MNIMSFFGKREDEDEVDVEEKKDEVHPANQPVPLVKPAY